MQKPGRRTGGFARHLSYANVVSTLALLFAMTGGALAASHYVITSTKQIKPSVLKKLTPKAAPAYSAGSGLVLAGHQFSLNPSAIPTIPTIPTIPAAFPGGGCTAGSLLQSLSASGTPTCFSQRVYSATSGAGGAASETETVDVPAGTWLVLGNATGFDPSLTTFGCQLTVAGTQADLGGAVTDGENSTAALVTTATTTAYSTGISLICSAASDIQYATVVAIPVAALS